VSTGGLPPSVAEAAEGVLGPVRAVASVGGGCIAHASRLDTASGPAFLKWGRGDVGASFEAESAGLAALRAAASPLLVPGVLAARDAREGDPGFLLLEWVETAQPGAGYWERFGEGLAALHRAAEPEGRYGFRLDNRIGRLPQANGWRTPWPEFFRLRRLEPQIERAHQGGEWRPAWDPLADRLLVRLPDLLPATPEASTLHGDLWSGNALSAADGRAALVDPAAYYGHREADLAMTELFGGFGGGFYSAYRAAWPLEPGYEERREVYNLYHLLSHLNHFGAGYAGGVGAMLRRFGG
jgi:protein-ribulosamine 3-kinase